MDTCSFCGKGKNQVERLVQGGGKQAAGAIPVVHICNECIGLCAEIIGQRTHEPSYEQLSDWAVLNVDDVAFRWCSARVTVSTQDAKGKLTERWPMLMLSVGKQGRPAMGVMYPDGTKASEELATEAIRQMWDRL